VWVVHYPEELVDPWVDAEAGRAGMTESERRSYKEGFVSDLAIGEAEPFLFNVYAFGPRPLSFSPFSEKIALVTVEGKRVRPIRYDRTLDQPISGMAQGLVFFPKQEGRDFAIAVQGMGVYDERIFAFADSTADELFDDESMGSPEDADVVIVELPPAPAKKNVPQEAPPPTKQAAAPRQEPPPPVVSPPNVSAEPAPAGPEIVVVEPEESQSMEEFVEALRSRGTRDPAEGSATQESETQESATQGPAYSSRERTVRAFLELWVKNDPETMYSMLSESSKKLFSKETFESDLRKGSDFRGALRDGYTIDWLGVERAKIVAAKRVLLIRTLVSRTLGVVREESDWKIVW
jgi:hypothetical protein